MVKSCQKDIITLNPGIVYTEGEGSIGPRGGIVMIDDETSPLNGAFVEIPEGALKTDTLIKISQAPAEVDNLADSLATLVKFEPQGLVFEIPITIGIPVQINNADTAGLHIFHFDPDSLIYTKMPKRRINPDNHIIIGETMHFSYYTAIDQSAKIDIEMLHIDNKIGVRLKLKDLDKIRTNHSTCINSGYCNVWEVIRYHTSYDKSVFNLRLYRHRSMWNDDLIESKNIYVWRRTHGAAADAVVLIGYDGPGNDEEAYRTSYISQNGVNSELAMWNSGEPLVFYFDDFQPDSGHNYYVKVKWFYSQMPVQNFLARATPLYEFDNKEVSMPVSQMTPYPVDQLHQSMAIDNSYIDGDGDGDDDPDDDFGTPCPGTPTVMDVNGNTYRTVQIGSQCWMRENLKTTQYKNGTNIIYVGNNNSTWQNNTTGAYAWYENNSSWGDSYGALYNWYAVNHHHGLCPEGWRVPDNNDWNVMAQHHGGVNTGGKIKSIRTEPMAHPRWDSPNTNASNESGFSGMPGGARQSNGTYSSLGQYGTFWTSVESSSTLAYGRDLSYLGGNAPVSNYGKNMGQSVRCIKISDGDGNAPQAAFAGNPTSGTAPLTVSFTDQSTGDPTSWQWNFGDGNTSTQQNPQHTYQNEGNYTVELTASNSFGSDTEIKENYIQVDAAGEAPVAGFSGTPTSGTAPLTVSFTDESTGEPESWQWVFGDGNTSMQQNPQHTYQNEGNYTVELTVENSHGTDTKVKMNYITVSDDNDDPDIIYGDGVTDIDGNEYVTVVIGNQEWMAENLRVTRYNNGDNIPTGLSNTNWKNTTEGAYAIYDHNAYWTDGINSPEEMVEAYGKLYNWYAVDDPRGLCPEGWHVPSDAEWTELVNYVVSQGYPNVYDNPNGAGNALKSCRQVGSPLGGDCDTSEHPRWSSYQTYYHYGFDEFGFSALPGGHRKPDGSFTLIGSGGYWWSSTEGSSTHARSRTLIHWSGKVFRTYYYKTHGFSLRCVRDH